jgi:hypothetical protein
MERAIRSYSAPQEGHVSIKEFPCSSDSFSLGIPDRRWRPSTFYHKKIKGYKNGKEN